MKYPVTVFKTSRKTLTLDIDADPSDERAVRIAVREAVSDMDIDWHGAYYDIEVEENLDRRYVRCGFER